MHRYYPSLANGSLALRKSGVWNRVKRYSGIGFLIAVGYMDPGNWATDIESGSRFGYGLISIILLASLVAMLLQTLCVRLGVASGRDLAELCRERFHPKINLLLWSLAEIAIIACDFAEVLGTALALKLLFGMPLLYGILLTGLDTFIILALQDKNLFNLRRLVVLLVLIISISFLAEIIISQPQWDMVLAGFIPEFSIFKDANAWLLAIGIFGATVMPHNLYLHTSAVKKHPLAPKKETKKHAIKMLTIDTLITLSLAFFVNAAILVLSATAFHFTGHGEIKEIDEAYYMLAPILGTAAASIIFAIALLASGQSSTFTGTLAGQIIFQGFLRLKIPLWKQRLITRSLSIIPAWFLVASMGEGSIGKLLVLSQVVLSMQLPFAIIPLIMFNRDAKLMGKHRMSRGLFIFCIIIALAIISANIYLISRVI